MATSKYCIKNIIEFSQPDDVLYSYDLVKILHIAVFLNISILFKYTK